MSRSKMRVLLFDNHPNNLLIMGAADLPPIDPPFTREAVTRALKEHFDGDKSLYSVGVAVTAGRYTPAIRRLAAVANQERIDLVTAAQEEDLCRMLDTPGVSDIQRAKAELSVEKFEVDEQIRSIKADIQRAKDDAYRGRQLAKGDWDRLNQALSTKQARSIAIQNEQRELKKRRRSMGGRSREVRFVDLAKEHLTKTQFAGIWAKIDEEFANTKAEPDR